MSEPWAKPEHKVPHPEQGSIKYGLVEKMDMDAAARIYLKSFPRRVRKWFYKEHDAAHFYADLMELMRLAHGRTFFAARHNGQLIGYLILMLPNRSLFRALLREGFILRVVAHALSGCYGFSLSVLGRALKEFFFIRNARMGAEPSDSPHVYVVVVEKQYTRRGIGFALIEQARLTCRESFSQMWLYVETDNVGTIRLYERIGFRIVKSDPSQHLMAWDFKTSGKMSKAE